MAITLYVTIIIELGPLVRIVIAEETARLMVKAFSFAVEMARDNEMKTNWKHFVYFLFCPTAVYRSSYPKRASRNYPRMIAYVWIMASLSLLALKISSYTAKPFIQLVEQNLQNPGTVKDIPFTLTVSTFGTAWFSGFFYAYVAFFFGGLHCWSNFWAEVLYFGDRQFYKDWRLTTNHNDFFISWNAVVQEWLREYFYEPIKTRFGKKYAGPTVMFLSGILHDYVTFGITSVFVPVFTLNMTLMSFAQYSISLPLKKTERRKINSDKKNEDSIDENKNIETVRQFSKNCSEAQPERSLISFMYICLPVMTMSTAYFGLMLEYYSRKLCHDDSYSWVTRFGIRTLRCVDYRM
jgi:hypothetical protein